MFIVYRLSCDQTLCAKFNETEQSAAELLRFNLGAVRHLGFDRGLDSIPMTSLSHFNTNGQCTAKLLMIQPTFCAPFSGGVSFVAKLVQRPISNSGEAYHRCSDWNFYSLHMLLRFKTRAP